MLKSTTPNKALVLRAFDTLFNKRDYAAAETFWSPDYIQHSAHIHCKITARAKHVPTLGPNTIQ